VQNICQPELVLKRGHFVMPIQLIFGPDAKNAGKDIIFFTADAGLVLQVVHLTMDSGLMPPCSYLFSVCN